MAKTPDTPTKPTKTRTPGARHATRSKVVAPVEPPPANGMPTREQLLTFIAEHPGQAGKREIAKAFGISGGARIALKRMLKELGEDGLVEKRQKRLTRVGDLPAVSVLNIVDRDADGDFVAQPVNWDADHAGPPRVLLVQGKGKPIVPAPGIGDRILAHVDPATKDELEFAYTGRIIKVLEKRPASTLGVIRVTPGGGARVEPVDRKQKEFLVDPDDMNGAKDGDLVAVEVKRLGRYGLARARVGEVIGEMTSEKAVSMIAIHAHDIPYIFPTQVLEAAEKARPAPLAGREDWRHIPLVTIDPADAKDHDDAVFAEPDPDPENPGGYLVSVAIADVAWYVRPNSPLDREALRRGNSVYFPDRVVPMLPERISNDLCSLREGEDRPAIAVKMQFTAEGKKKFHWFQRIMMRSAAKLAYPQAQAAIDGRPDDKTGPLLEPVLKPLWAAYEIMKRGRDNREPLDLDLPERKVIVGADGAIEKIIVPERLDAHKLVEEFMIQANVAAAETLERRKSPLVYRVHDAPSLAKLEALRQFLTSIEMNLPKSGNLRPSHFNLILEKVKESEHAAVVNEVVLRSQSQAVYSPENIGHFGLNLRRYAHFTSPIRRYADLIVHRALIRSLEMGEGGLQDGIETELEAIAQEISGAERRAMAAERETIDRLVAHWLADRIGASFQGRIAGVTRSGLFVKLDETNADGFVPMSGVGSDFYEYDEARHAVIGARYGEMYQLGDRVEVKLVEVAPVAGALRFELLSDGKILPKGARKVTERGFRRPPGRPSLPPKGRPGPKRR
ncbi:ribonuclease R [Kaistia dalseonensis]|uniref:Ribonuclease R n=1 Tax=Kaistia dalseonensis TaxID=410840 RepID=A0ABU0H6T4_9HYPH|nr:ribonuclease R [Kaistia dalseonensis]